MLLFHAIIQKNINFLRRSSKKYDFIIENIFEEVNIIDDIKIIELYFERNEQAIKETDIKYGKFCRNMAYKILNNHQDSEECVNTTYLEMWDRIPPTRPAKWYTKIFRQEWLPRHSVAEHRQEQGMYLKAGIQKSLQQ